jgi:uncharacterized protein (TIGR02271 family)
MNEARRKRIVDQDGLEGDVEIDLYTRQDSVVARFGEGKAISLPLQMLVTRKDGSYYLPLSVASLSEENAEDSAVHVIPVVEENLEVQKIAVPRSTVRISKVVHEEQVTVDEPLMEEAVEVEHVAVNQYIDQPVEVRYEGDRIIVPLVEEVLVVQKRLLLREELHITKRRIEKHEPEQFTLRREEVEIERIPRDSEVS